MPSQPNGRTSFTQDVIASFGPPFGSSSKFYILAAVSLLLGSLLGVVALAWQSAIYFGLNSWRGAVFDDLTSLDKLGFGNGHPWYCAVGAVAGAISGIIQSFPFFCYPKKMKYLFAEVRDGCYETFCEGETACGCKPVTEGDEGVKACASEARGGSYSGEKDHPLNTIRPFLAILLCNTVALAGGCVAGPEAVAAAMGSAGADFFTTHINFMQGRCTVRMGGERGGRELFALAGMVGGISSIFPSPIAAILLVLEISQVAGRRFEIDFPGTSQSQSVILQRMHSSSLYLLYFTTSALVSVTSYAICQGVLYITYKQDLNIVVPLAYVEPPVQTPLGVGEQVATQAIGALAGLFGSLVSFIFIAMQIFARRSARKCTNLTNRAWKKMMKRFCKGNNSPPQEQVLPGLIVTQVIRNLDEFFVQSILLPLLQNSPFLLDANCYKSLLLFLSLLQVLFLGPWHGAFLQYLVQAKKDSYSFPGFGLTPLVSTLLFS